MMVPFRKLHFGVCYQIGYLDLDMKNFDEIEKRNVDP